MKDTPKGWPRISSGIYYREAGKMIDWLCDAFGLEVRLKVEGDNGRVEHSELTYGDGVIMVANERVGAAASRWGADLKSPLSVGGANTQGMMLYADDVDAHCATAHAAGAKIAEEPTVHDYGEDYWRTAVPAPSIPRGISGGSCSAFAAPDPKR